MPTPKKVKTVEELAQRLSRCSIVIGADFRGMKVAEMTGLRRQLRQVGVEVKVVKNTLFRLAAQQVGKADVSSLVEGPTVLILGYGDVVTPVKALVEHIRAARIPLAVRRAYLDGQVLAAAELQELANLPPREVLLGQVMGALWGPLITLAGQLNAGLRQLAGLLESRARQLEEGGSP